MTICAPFVDEARPMYPRGTLPGALFLFLIYNFQIHLRHLLTPWHIFV